jgi:hypothetical protein
LSRTPFAYATAEFDFEGQYFLRVVLANMAAGGTVRICVSGVCRKAPANTRIFMNEQHFAQRWIARQTRSVVIAACNRASCMRPSKAFARWPSTVFSVRTAPGRSRGWQSSWRGELRRLSVARPGCGRDVGSR